MSKLCFCTLAMGHRYRAHAQLLSADIQQHAPDIPLVVLTDYPEDFLGFSQVIAHRHRLQSVLGYHDKMHVVERAIATFETCIFLDADIRIIGPVPNNMEFPQGLTGRFGCSILKHNKHSKVRPALPLIEASAQTLGLDLDTVIWLHECLFMVRRQQGIEQLFLRYWKSLAHYFQIHKIYSGEGNVMGLAAAAAGFHTGFRRTDSFPFFKDVIEKERIKTGESALDRHASLFQIHGQIEYPQHSFSQKVIDKLQRQFSIYYRWTKLQVSAPQHNEFPSLKSAHTMARLSPR